MATPGTMPSRLVHTFGHVPYDEVFSVISVDSKKVLVLGSHALVLWSIFTRQRLKQISDGRNFNCIARVDNETFLGGTMDGTLGLWSLATTYHCIASCKVTNGEEIRAVANIDGVRFLGLIEHGPVWLWNSATGEYDRVLAGPDDGDYYYAVAYVSDERLLTGSYRGLLQLWDIATGECIRVFEGHVDTVNTISCHQSGERFLTASDDWTVKLWDVTTGECVKTFEERREKFVYSVAWVDSVRFLSGSGDCTIRLWNTDTGECIRKFEGYRSTRPAGTWSIACPSNEVFVSASDGALEMFAISGWLLLKSLILIRKLLVLERASPATEYSRGELMLQALVGDKTPDEIFRHVLSFLY